MLLIHIRGFYLQNYVGNYEVFLDEMKNIDKIGNDIYKNLPSNLDVLEVYQKYPDIFQWI